MNICWISKYASPPKYGVAARIFYLAKEFVKNRFRESGLLPFNNNYEQYFAFENRAKQRFIGVNVVGSIEGKRARQESCRA